MAIITNMAALTDKAYGRHQQFFESTSGAINPTELVAALICQADTFEDGIRQAQEQIQGSCTMLLLTEAGIYAARDRRGRTPLIVGTKAEGFSVASESCAFPNLGFETRTEIGPGEIVFMAPDGIEQRRPPLDAMQVCSFLWVYYGYPASSYEGINVESVRYRCGCSLAKNDDATPDYVAGIPDSGIGHALGYAHCRQIPYKRPYVKYTPTWPR